MSKASGFLEILILNLCLAACVPTGVVLQAAVTPTREQVLDLKMMQTGLGLVFKPADDVQPKISRDAAIAAAKANGGTSGKASRIAAELGYLSNPNLEQSAAAGSAVDPTLLKHPLVWIVTFLGVNMSSSGPPGASHTIAHEYNVVIDAESGKYLMAFIYRLESN